MPSCSLVVNMKLNSLSMKLGTSASFSCVLIARTFTKTVELAAFRVMNANDMVLVWQPLTQIVLILYWKHQVACAATTASLCISKQLKENLHAAKHTLRTLILGESRRFNLSAATCLLKREKGASTISAHQWQRSTTEKKSNILHRIRESAKKNDFTTEYTKIEHLIPQSSGEVSGDTKLTGYDKRRQPDFTWPLGQEYH